MISEFLRGFRPMLRFFSAQAQHEQRSEWKKSKAFKSISEHSDMNVKEQIKKYIASQPEAKRSDIQELHSLILQVLPQCKLWFLDGKDDKGKTVTNPNIGYGLQNIKYADGTTREFYQIGISPNATGISVYIIGIKDKTYLANTYGHKLGKARVSGYCIKFKRLKDINIDVLEAAILYGVEAKNGKREQIK